MRIIFYSGRDKVGKTSMALITAMQIAKQGKKALLVSMDKIDNLSNTLGISIGNTPTKIDDNFWALQINYYKRERHWDIVHKYLLKNMKWDNFKGIYPEEVAIIPGMDEIIQLLELNRYAIGNDYDVIIVDYKLLGEVLRILSYPELFKWWYDKQFGKERHLLKIVRPFAKFVSGGFELPDEQVMDSIEFLLKQVLKLQHIMLNKNITSFRFVLNPDKMNIEETKMDFTYTNMLGFHVDAIIINKILPDETSEGYFAKWYKKHMTFLKEIDDSFTPLPIFQIPLLDNELKGIGLLNKVGEYTFKEFQADRILYPNSLFKINKVESRYRLELIIPSIEKETVQVIKNEKELWIHTSAYKRIVYLPKIFWSHNVNHVSIGIDKLEVIFK